MNFQQKVFAVAKKIPKGKVATYCQIAKMIGSPKAYRAVGNALNKNFNPKVPCHRVVRSDGGVGGFREGRAAKIKKLRGEGMVIVNGKVELEKCKIEN
jgi:O-6-methylguanine DNA methyltransferase